MSVVERLCLGIDLGNDTMKISFAYKQDKETVYGKLAPSHVQGGIPARAYYDAENGKWLFAEEIRGNDYTRVVKIKKLLSFLDPITTVSGGKRTIDEGMTAENERAFREGKDFPYFFFPEIRSSDGFNAHYFPDLVRTERTFEAGETPQDVCRAFFAHCAKIAEEGVKAYTKKFGVTFKEIVYTVFYPTQASVAYKKELLAEVKEAFSSFCSQYDNMSTPRALATFARTRGLLREGEDALMFDMGECSISVVKVRLKGEGKGVTIDTADGHERPLHIGGVDVDEAIMSRILARFSGVTTIGGVNETVVHARQYELLQTIKRMKASFGDENSIYYRCKSFPLTVYKEVAFRENVTPDDVACAVVEGEDSIAAKVLAYVKAERARDGSRDVKKIFLAGGLSECKPLVEYLRNGIKGADILTFDGETDGALGEFSLDSSEDNAYAPAVGGALMAATGESVELQLARSYGTFAVSDHITQLSIAAEKGKTSQGEFVQPYGWNLGGDALRGERLMDGVMYSIRYSEKELAQYVQNPSLLLPQDTALVKRGLVGSRGRIVKDVILKEDAAALREALGWQEVDTHEEAYFYYGEGKSRKRVRFCLTSSTGASLSLLDSMNALLSGQKLETTLVGMLGQVSVSFISGVSVDDMGNATRIIRLSGLELNKVTWYTVDKSTAKAGTSHVEFPSGLGLQECEGKNAGKMIKDPRLDKLSIAFVSTGSFATEGDGGR